MWLPLTCTQCSHLHFSRGGSLETYESDWVPCDFSDDGIYRAECRKGHPIRAVLQALKHEILFESGAAAMLLGFRREAITSFQVALERFFEFGIRVLLKAHGVTDSDVEATWKTMARQSERQVGAFLQLYLLAFKEVFQTVEDLADLRNRVVHKGFIPDHDSTLRFGRRVFEIIETTQLRLEQHFPEAFEMVTRQPLSKAAKELYDRGEVPIQSGEQWFGVSTMCFPMALAYNVKRDSPRSFDAAIEEIRRRLPVYGHAVPRSAQ